VAVTAAAFLAWFTETLRTPLGTLAAWTFLVPVSGVGFAAVLLGEAPSGWTALGIVLVLGSLWVVLRPAREPD
jgi:probable blue pigment (indigoidine) exporter